MQIRLCVALAGLCTCGSWAGGGETYFPGDQGAWETVDPQDAGYDRERLNEAVAYAGSQQSSALVVLYRGRMLAERLWTRAAESDNGSPRYRRMVVGTTSQGHVIEDVASVQKSVVSFLVGVALGEGKLALDYPVRNYLGNGWSQTTPEQESRITLRHLLSMTSGLNDALEYDAAPGAKWRYNTGAYGQLVGVLEAALDQPIADITRTRLTEPIGMNDSRWVPRPWAARIDAAAKIGFATSARDLARFGLLIAAGGTWHDRDVLRSPGYLELALTPSQKLNRSYGFLWWLGGQPSHRRARGDLVQGSLVPSAPADMVAAQGALGRKLYVAPSRHLIVVRLGDDPGRDFNREFWRRLAGASATME